MRSIWLFPIYRKWIPVTFETYVFGYNQIWNMQLHRWDRLKKFYCFHELKTVVSIGILITLCISAEKLPFNKLSIEKWVCWKISFVWMYLLPFEPLDLHLTCFLSCQRMLYICTWWNEKCFIIFPEVKNLFINYNYISPKRQSACAIIRKMLAN